MLPLLAFIPFCIFLSVVVLYRHQGKKEFLKFDLVHFLYAFVFAPLMFLWLKFVLYYLLQGEDSSFSLKETFVYDSLLSMSMLYVFAFIVIHTLTVSFSLKKKRDPGYDIFHHSEFYHIWVSHAAIYAGGMVVATLASFFNLFYPFYVANNKAYLVLLMVLGGGIGLLSYGSISFFSTSFSSRTSARFSRFMKLLYLIFVLAHLFIYFLLSPPLSLRVGTYWFFTSTFAVLATCGIFLDRSQKAKKLIHKIHASPHTQDIITKVSPLTKH